MTDLPDTFLDSYKNNRNSFCGQWSVKGTIKEGGKTFDHFSRLGCKCWNCPVCGPKRARLLKRAISETASDLGLQRFLTLTLDPRHCTAKDSAAYIRETWAKFRVYLQRHYSESISYISILEYQKSGYAHLHVLIDRYIPFTWIQQAWRRLGGGTFVNVKFVDVHRIAAYLSKYLTKEMFLTEYPLGARRYSTSRGIRLFKKPKKGLWQLIKRSLDVMREASRDFKTEDMYDEHGLLSWFRLEVIENC